MGLVLPDLDDRRWIDLVDEARTLIPVHAPGWTDHNVHDPGITLLELLAWIAEMDIYRTNRIPDRHRLAFLALADATARPPRGSSTVVGFELRDGDPATPLPAGLELLAGEGSGPTGTGAGPTDAGPGRTVADIRFRTEESLTVVPGHLAAIQCGAAGDPVDVTAAWRRGEPVAAFSEGPSLGMALHLGLSESPPPRTPVHIEFVVEGGGADERARLLRQMALEEQACEPPAGWVDCDPCAGGAAGANGNGPAGPNDDGGGGSKDNGPAGTASPFAGEDEGAGEERLPEHHSIHLVWEQAVGPGVWRPLDADAGEVEDGTRALTLDGTLTLRLPEEWPIAPVALGGVPAPLHYLRARIIGGRYDAPPRLRLVQLNGVRARQESAVRTSWALAPGADVSGPAPSPGQRIGLRFTVDGTGEIDTLELTDADPSFHVLGYRAPTSTQGGSLELEAALLGVGTGRPGQVFDLPRPQVAGSSLRILSLEEGDWREWRRASSWVRSGRRDAHYLLDAGRARLELGDGERGRVAPAGSMLVAVYDATSGAAGDLPARSLDTFATDAHNRALLPDLETVSGRIERILQPLDAAGGRDDETLVDAAARALDDLAAPQRAVTLEDIESLALETPGTRIARATAKPAAHPAFPCVEAPGVVTVVLVPWLPESRPAPSPGLLRLVAAYLAPRRVLGTRIEVAGPEYVEVTVRASVRGREMVDPSSLAARLRQRIDDFFHPLEGGPDGDGWPFGRDVYRSEVLQVLDETDGVDHVLSLELVDARGTAVCGNLCLPPCGLVDAGEHDIEVVIP